ncbi:MAG: zf-TFIIB domain-containing protein [Propionicimonas sp.]|nr:zf-TFIIB domain-containing protein [Propionicimonas sp.]
MAQPERTLICPKCAGMMRSYERNGIVIDQCIECRGIFLDRGELERLIDAESGFYGRGDSRQDTYPPSSGGRGGGHHGDRRSADDGGTGRPRKRGGFLGDLFD